MNIFSLPPFQIAGHNFVAFRFALATLLLAFRPHELTAQSPRPSQVFYKTQNSDEWVKHTFHVQKRYSRVLVVDSSDKPPRQIRIGSLNLNTRDNWELPLHTFPIPFRLLSPTSFERGSSLQQ
jgi:hypothetical protein